MPKQALNSRAIGSLCLVATATGWAFGWSAMKLLIRDWPPLFSAAFPVASFVVVAATMLWWLERR